MNKALHRSPLACLSKQYHPRAVRVEKIPYGVGVLADQQIIGTLIPCFWQGLRSLPAVLWVAS
ncbi:hypothetical protein RIEGSTA812A_PEG_679 [invertebrate metagenome]|uniref:Uncharacterized protein n=1 Tax=invertebrate metagenome TaxID=1711999 RepID=A0A484H5C4_9ZZZZ